MSESAKQAQKGETVIITSARERKPVAKLEAYEALKKKPVGVREEEGFVLSDAFWDPEATKVRHGKLPEAVRLEMEFMGVIEEAGYTLLAIERRARCARTTGRGASRSVDRMIAAQAPAVDMPVISRDAVPDGLGVRRIW